MEQRRATERRAGNGRREAERLLDLQLTKLLDTPREERFDRLTRLAAKMLGVPTVLISLVDEDRQWFKSTVGWEGSESSRQTSFCRFVVDEQAPVVVEDARLDSRFRDNPLVSAKQRPIRFYAGIPIHGPNQYVIGSFCAIDSDPRRLTDSELSSLEDIAALVEQEICFERQLAEAAYRAEQAAYHDAVAGLPNLRLLQDRAEQAIQRAQHDGTRVYLLRSAVPALPGVSILSHSDRETDRMIRICAARLREALDASVTIARGLDDEFVVLCPDQPDDGNLQAVSRQIQAALNVPIEMDGKRHDLRTWTGAAIAPDTAMGIQRLMLQAGMALKMARRENLEQAKVFTAHTAQRQNRRLDVHARLKRAVDQGDIAVHFQPILGVDSRRIIGAEALSRWEDPELGFVSPMEFIPIAEDTGLIRPLTDTLLSRVCEELRLIKPDSKFPEFKISVNVTGGMVRSKTLTSHLHRLLSQPGITPDLLSLEITEGSYFEADGQIVENIRSLRDCGVALSIDDFGTGYASFGNLKNLPVDTLKLDRSFVTHITRKHSDATIVHSLISMARRLGVSVIAEGVEEEDQLTFLRAYQCDRVQGFLFDKALNSADFRSRLATQPHLATAH